MCFETSLRPIITEKNKTSSFFEHPIEDGCALSQTTLDPVLLIHIIFNDFAVS